MSEDPKRALADLQRTRERLREGIASRVNRLEETSTPEAIEKWIQGEYERFNAVRPELED
jgi:hypothetical protein